MSTFAATINCEEYEYVAEPTDGVNLNDGSAWWATNIKYRKVGSRKWRHHFFLIDVHSWEREAIIAAIDYAVERAA